jgi:alcohol dehydrogenase class IV
MATTGFALAKTPQLYFRAGALEILPAVLNNFGSKVVLVTGQQSLVGSPHWQKLMDQLRQSSIEWIQVTVGGEPTPGLVDNAVSNASAFNPQAVVGIGGGSVLDAGKAISAMIPSKNPVKDYLEGIGTAKHDGRKIPFIAVPTTAGTGSEAAKNAVLSETGPNGFKRSLRHDNFVPDVAIIDPELALTCPAATTAASGMDAFTQLLESYVSTGANSVSDALALEGLRQISSSLVEVYHHPLNVRLRTGMALAAYLSGITLTNAGLGVVHGFASTIGGYYNISHGVICSALMWSANAVTVKKLRTEKCNDAALQKYASIGKLFAGRENGKDEFFIDLLLQKIKEMTFEMKIPSLRELGIPVSDFQRIAMQSDSKNNPVILSDVEKLEVLGNA